MIDSHGIEKSVTEYVGYQLRKGKRAAWSAVILVWLIALWVSATWHSVWAKWDKDIVEIIYLTLFGGFPSLAFHWTQSAIDRRRRKTSADKPADDMTVKQSPVANAQAWLILLVLLALLALIIVWLFSSVFSSVFSSAPR